ncbi:MAG: hypothetical protein ABIO24_14620, partial [Saprospiraceae bacterium]
PAATPANAGRLGDVVEVKISTSGFCVVDIQPIRNLIARKKDIGLLIAIEIANAHPTPVVDILIVKNVEGVGIGNGIGKGDTCIGGVEPVKQRFFPTGGK